jgi:hypothetical protein
MKDQEINMAMAKACPSLKHIDCHDLNVMHEAEILVTGGFAVNDEWLAYVRLLHGANAGCGERATARQRAEAFLRVKGLWKE